MARKEFEESIRKRNQLSEKVIGLLKENNLSYSEALEVLRNTQSRLERASLKNKV